MEIKIKKEEKHIIPQGMIGLFFEDINYAADGGLYAEMIENRSFEFYRAGGDAGDYYAEYDGGYGWKCYQNSKDISLRYVTGSPLSEENPHYMRANVKEKHCGFSNKAYDGLYLEQGKEYKVTFWARKVQYEGDFCVQAIKNGTVVAECLILGSSGIDGTYNFFEKYTGNLVAKETVSGAEFVMLFTEVGIVEFDFISMFPADAVAGIFRKDLFDRLKDLHPGFLRFPGGCIVEGNTYINRYRYKNTLKEPWRRKNAWNRWAVHGNCEKNEYQSIYAHYNQSFGLGFYEYFLLCELIGAKPLPVLNVGLACQYQSKELVAVDSPEFKELVQDALDLIEFANGDKTTTWGKIRTQMGHEEPFGLELIGVGNEQWQTETVDFFKRYEVFEKAVHDYAPEIKLIGSAGPDVISDKYTMAWKFYRDESRDASFSYAVDEHYYVKPQWLFDNVDFYDNYSRKIKVFAGEYAAHPATGMNMPESNTLEGAIAEAAFMTGLERNCDVVILASYAPLFARLGYAQWSPDMIWFDDKSSYVTPSYHVQKMFAENMGNVTLETYGQEKELATENVYYSVSYQEDIDTIIVKIVNGGEKEQKIVFNPEDWKKTKYTAQVLSHAEKRTYNSISQPSKVSPIAEEGNISEGIVLSPYSFAVIRM